MSDAGEVDAIVPVVENPEEEVKPPVEPKPLKEMKPKASQEKKPKQTKLASHPPYFEVVSNFWLIFKCTMI